MSKLQAVFLDRDGTIGGNGLWCHPRDFSLYPGSAEAIVRLKEAGIKVFAFTNQNRISKGEVTLEEFVDQFSTIQAAAEHGLDLTQCAVVGDVGAWDMLAAARVGALKVLVRTGLGESSLGEYRHTWADVEPDYIAADLRDAVAWLLSTTD